MTEQEILKGYDITVHTFNGDLLPDEVGFYDPKTRTAFISDNILTQGYAVRMKRIET